MANVFRVIKDKNYSVISNYYLRDKRLRLESIGLMTIILSLSSDYKITMNNLLKLTNENYRTVKLILKELKECGYVVINKQRDEKGHFYFDYIFYEDYRLNPLYIFYKMDNDSKGIDNNNQTITQPPITFTTMEKVYTGELIYINTKDNKKINIDKSKLNLSFLTESLISWKFIEINDINLFGYDEFLTNFYNDNEDKSLVVKVVSYTAKKIISNEFLDSNREPIKNLLSYFKTSCIDNLNSLKCKNNPHLFDDWE